MPYSVRPGIVALGVSEAHEQLQRILASKL